MSSIIGGGNVRAGAINVDNPVVQEAALKAKVQVVDISGLASHDDLGHDQFVSVAVIYSQLQHPAGPYRNTPGTFVFADDGGTMIRPVDIAIEAAAQ
jgi:esterase/lipase superfamily enzyme